MMARWEGEEVVAMEVQLGVGEVTALRAQLGEVAVMEGQFVGEAELGS